MTTVRNPGETVLAQLRPAPNDCVVSVLTDSQVRRWRANSQLLGEVGRQKRTAVETVGRLVGVQSQDRTDAALSIRARSNVAHLQDVADERANGNLVLTWTMRSTLHLHCADDLPLLLSVFGPARRKFGARDRQLGIDAHNTARAEDLLCEALSTGPKSRAQLKDVLAGCAETSDPQVPIHFIARAAAAGILAPVLDEGVEKFGALDPFEPVDFLASLADIAARYVRAFGPVSEADFRCWSGLPAAATKRAWEFISEDFEWVEFNSSTMLVDPGTSVDATGVRFVGGFDLITLAYRNRDAQLGPAHAKEVNAGGGLVRPAIIADGRIVGLWSYRKSDSPRVQWRLFEAAPAAAFAQEAIEVEAFLV